MGDMLCLGGAILATVVTVLQELSVKTTDVVEYLGLLGLFGSIITGIQMYKLNFLPKYTCMYISFVLGCFWNRKPYCLYTGRAPFLF